MARMRVRRGWVLGLMLAGFVAAGGAWAGPKHKGGAAASDDAKGAASAKPGAADDDDGAPAAGDGEGGEPKYKPILGPKKVDAGHEVTIDLPAGYLFLEAADAKKFMEKLG